MHSRAISVVVPCINGLPYVDECLDSLRSQTTELDVEIIVVNCCGNEVSDLVLRKFPDVVLMDRDERIGIPRMRAEGLRQARGDVVCFIEDHCIAPPTWIEAVRLAHESEFVGIGGPIENVLVERLVDRIVFLCEYGSVMPPMHAGRAEQIPGNNASYKRKALDAVPEHVRMNCWEYFINMEITATGGKLYIDPSMTILHKMDFSFFYFLRQRFNYSRSFAAMRSERMSTLMRSAYALGSPLLLPVLIFRTAAAAFSKKRMRLDFILGFPIIIAFMVSYVFGETVGFVLGAGNSLSEVE